VLESSAPGLAANEREPQEGKGLWPAKPFSLSPCRRLTAELQQSGLLPVKLEPELLEPRSHRIPEAPRVGFVLETSNDIVGVSVRSCERNPCSADCTTSTPSRRRRQSGSAETLNPLKSGTTQAGWHFCGAQGS
jgi:hypothetical protein